MTGNRYTRERISLGKKKPKVPKAFAWIKPGVRADYHAVIGGDVTIANAAVRTAPFVATRPPSRFRPTWVVFIEGKAGWVACQALTPPKPTRRLTEEQLLAMLQVRDGADVYSYRTALRLREVERAFPDLITICPAVDPPKDGRQQQPYFGAILTAAGQDAIRGIVFDRDGDERRRR